jgi:two-component system, LytTR family, response regulator
VVFVTAFDQFAIRAFDAQAIDYLLKPINPARFAATLDRLRTALADRTARNVVPRLEALLQQLATQQGSQRVAPGAALGSVGGTSGRLSVRLNGRTTLLDPRSIDRLDVDDNDVCISAGSQRLRVRETLSAVHARLPAELFLRVHRSCVVNVQRVQQLEPYFHGDLVIYLANGTKVTSGRTYRREVRAAFGLAREDE